jgi:hypothetical protein
MVENSMFTTPARLQIHRELLEQARRMQTSAVPPSGDVIAPSAGMAPTASPNPPISLKPVLDHGSSGGAPAAAAAAAAAAATSQPKYSVSISMTPITSPDPAAAAVLAPVLSPDLTIAAVAGAPVAAAVSSHPAHAERKYGTVGAVALDERGELAAAISTGGMSLTGFGRIGDSPLVGAGFYANRRVAVACTGHGETFIRAGVAKDVACLQAYKSLSLSEATAEAMRNGEALCGADFEGGLIAVDERGHISMPFNSKGMYRGCVTSEHKPFVAVWKE